jgi:hypothetical protein
MTRRFSPLVRLLLLFAALQSAAGCGEQDVDLQVLVDRDNNATFGEVGALRIGIRTACNNTPTYYEPYALNDDTLQQHVSTTVQANTPFSVDVWGCVAVEGCADSPIARGCNQLEDGVPENSETPRIVPVLLRDLDDPDQDCPIEPPCPGAS